MNNLLAHLSFVLPIGIGATAVMDVWALLRKRLWGVDSLDYALVGRWLAYLTRGRFSHTSIAASPAVAGERLIGWTAHYLIGMVFAWLLLLSWGIDWARQPTIGPALLVGIGSVAAPFLLMQPGMGLGIAASRARNPGAARVRSLVTHGVFGLGLYVAGWAVFFFNQ
jgi:hypothetical protein